MHATDARGVELGLGQVDRRGDAVPEPRRDRVAAHVSGKRRHEHFVPLLERGKNGPPGVGAESERMQKKERLPRATVMSDGRANLHVEAFPRKGHYFNNRTWQTG